MIPMQRYLGRSLHKLCKTTAPETTVTVLDRDYERDSMTNISPAIISRLRQKVLCRPNSPLSLLWGRIKGHFESTYPDTFSFIHHNDPVVTCEQNFDELLIGPLHPSRSPNDSYYINRKFLLRSHMTAHERKVMEAGKKSFLLVGDVYRRDEIDSSHMPVFHQVEGVRIFRPAELLQKEDEYKPIVREVEKIIKDESLPPEYEPRIVKLALADLYLTLNRLMVSLFGEGAPYHWQSTQFPYTQPSMESEVKYENRLLEVFGCGILDRRVLHQNVLREDPDAIGWAFGMGLERIAMVLYGIPDIRLFWTDDPRFTEQFSPSFEENGRSIKFVPFSRYPPIARDISFYIDSKRGVFEPGEFYELIREVAPDLVESVSLVDEYVDPKAGLQSRCYRIVYRAMDKTLTDDLVNEIQSELRNRASELLDIKLR